MQLSQRAARPIARSGPQSVRSVTVRAAGATAWDSWDSYIEKRPKVPQPNAKEQKMFSAIGASIAQSAASFKPRFGAGPASSDSGGFKQVKAAVPSMSADLHDKLEALGLVELKSVLGLPASASLQAGTISYTTTDVNAGIAVTGFIKANKAYVALVATETERQASWSRLEGLLLHWACSSSKGSAWSPPPDGWSAVPSNTVDAGGAKQTSFEKHTEPGSQLKTYSLVLTLPLEGVLSSGGIVFVLKASDAQNTKWLKDASTDKDFFVDLHELPTVS